MKFLPLTYMRGSLSTTSVHRLFFIGIISLILTLPVAFPCADAQQTRSPQEIEGLPVLLSKMNVKIDRKSLEWIYTPTGKFRINAETLIVGMDGKEVTIKELLVPCDAEVTYATKNGHRLVQRIDIKRIADGASWQWTSETPQ